MTSTNLEQNSDSRGLSRRGYWGVKCSVSLVFMALQLAFYDPAFGIRIPVWAICAVVLLRATVQRLANLGFSKWWAAGLFVPVGNILLEVCCLVGPENYADRDEIDDLGAFLFVPTLFALVGELVLLSGEFYLMAEFFS